MINITDDTYFAGFDIGSTTAKSVIYDKYGSIVLSRYYRHQTKTIETAKKILEEAYEELGNIELDIAVTGSSGMGIAEAFGVPFVQEVVASAQFIKKKHPEIRTFIEIGGEDAKIIFFNDNLRPDIRMNGSCAGGTGTFIDQMAVLLNVDVSELNVLAEKAASIYPIASRCGVFAKTDIQALLSRHVPKEDIAASIFHSVALQVITTLTRGREIEKKILFGGGPLTFYPELRKALVKTLKIDNPDDLIVPSHSELIPAMGAALVRHGKPYSARVSELLSMSGNGGIGNINSNSKRLPPLFKSKTKYELWEKRHKNGKVPRVNLSDVEDSDLFLGIDSGSTTTKLVLTDEKGRFVLGYYGANKGNPIKAVKEGLDEFRERFLEAGFWPRVMRSATTGYGEDLIKAAFGLQDGVVETIAHYKAARRFDKDVSFIIDIGGQDMKAIYIRDHAVVDIQINEACSSGCGSFLETFANSLGLSIKEFAELACKNNSPFDLGTRCTVFMNSRVKQALREGATVSDISAGLAYSVVKNALYKALKLKNADVLGNKIVAQGGTFRNPAVLRALEILLNKDVIRPDIPELMGAYGAALTALYNHRNKPHESRIFNAIERSDMETVFSEKEISCNGCENRCTVLKLTFANGNHFYTGNRCEQHFTNNPQSNEKGKNLINEQLESLFNQKMEPEGDPILTYGIPRCLNMYENFPFWSAFLTTCGFRIVLSSPSNFNLSEKGTSTLMSENICFPAKLSHGHIIDLIEKKVDRIFYPTVVYEQKEYIDAVNNYNCPVVTGYPDLLKSAVNPQKYGIPLDNPVISLEDSDMLKKQLFHFFKRFGVDYLTVSRGVEEGLASKKEYDREVINKGQTLITQAEKEGRLIAVLAGRPYHIDPLINHGIPKLLTELGVDVISEKAVPVGADNILSDVRVLTQWSYTNRLYAAAKWVSTTRQAALIQLTSFGCGPDAVSTDEVRNIIQSRGKIYTLIKIDEIANLGAVKIRVRSLLEAIKENTARQRKSVNNWGKTNRIFMPEDRKRTLIAPYFSPFYSPLIPAAFRSFGYTVDILPPQDKTSVEFGLKHINNDMCYPAIIVAGDIIKALRSGQYDPKKTSVLLTQTGGQCRASSYVSLIKKGLADNGLSDVPLAAISPEDINLQPGFDIDKKELGKRLVLGTIFADPLAQMYTSTVVREKISGTSKALHSKYLLKMEKGVEKADFQYLLNLLRKAVADFNSIEINDKVVPRIGVVGEIFVKYNPFSNGNIIEWLSSQGVEVVLPYLQNFFMQRIVSETFNQKAYFNHSLVVNIKNRLISFYTNYHLTQIDRTMREFRFYRKQCNLNDLAEKTSGVVSLANQFGEGWLLTAEMIAMLEDGIGNIVCLQPFGCIANHITGKGMEKKLKEMFPHLNLLSLDMDAGTSEVNILNRLHFMIIGAREEMANWVETTPRQERSLRFVIPLEVW